MAHSTLRLFYEGRTQERLMVYLNRRGVGFHALAGLQWRQVGVRSIRVTSRQRIILSKDLGRELWRTKRLHGHLDDSPWVFRKEPPLRSNGWQGTPFTEQEIFEICGEPPEKPRKLLLTKLKRLATMKILKVLVTNHNEVELRAILGEFIEP